MNIVWLSVHRASVVNSRSTSKPLFSLRRGQRDRNGSPLGGREFFPSGHGLDPWSLHPTGLEDKSRGQGSGARGRGKRRFSLAPGPRIPAPDLGAVAQLGERLICIQEVAGSIPTSSTRLANRACSSVG